MGCRKDFDGVTYCDSHGRLLSAYLYAKGWHFCSRCNKAFNQGTLRCPCCNRFLRTHPRGSKGKKLWRVVNQSIAKEASSQSISESGNRELNARPASNDSRKL